MIYQVITCLNRKGIISLILFTIEAKQGERTLVDHSEELSEDTSEKLEEILKDTKDVDNVN